VWQSSPAATGSATANASSIVTAGDDMAHDSNVPADPVVVPEPLQETWPSETDLIFLPGSNKLLLTVQRPLMRVVFQDTFERIRAVMLFKNAFPNVYDAITMITDNLIRATESNDRATHIYNRLILDGDYTNNMSRLVSS
jgi:hypothetical protein